MIETASPDETQAMGAKVGAALRAGDVVSLLGDLGAGKTLFTKGIAVGVGVDARDVTSPTFVLMNAYPGRVPVRHYDLYRLESVDLESLGFYDAPEAVSVVEWGERAGESLGERLEVRFEVTGEWGRRLTLTGVGARGQALLGRVV